MLFKIFRRKLRKLQKESDFGRRFGWEVWFNNTHVADLEYERWLEDGQFWHAYRVIWLEDSELGTVPYADWPERGVTMRSRAFPRFQSSHYMAAGTAGAEILLRGLSVPDEYLSEDPTRGSR